MELTRCCLNDVNANIEVVILTSHEHNNSPEEVLPNDPVLEVHHPDTDVLVPQDIDGDIAGQAVGDEDREGKQALDHVSKTVERISQVTVTYSYIH